MPSMATAMASQGAPPPEGPRWWFAVAVWTLSALMVVGAILL